MSHQRNPSEGLNVGKGFPTSYSSFAVKNTDALAYDAKRSATPPGARASSGLKRRHSPPPVVGDVRDTQSTPALASSSDIIPIILSRKTWQKGINAVNEHRKLAMLFITVSALLALGVLLPLSNIKLPVSPRVPTPVNSDPVRFSTRDTAARPVSGEQAVSNRFSRWAQAVFDKDADSKTFRPISGFSAGVGDLEMPEELLAAAPDPSPAAALLAEKDQAERRAARWAARWAKNQKRRIEDAPLDDEEDKMLREHPSRTRRRQQVEVNAARITVTGKPGARDGVFQRIVRAFQASATAAGEQAKEAVERSWQTASPGANHILGTWGSSHPELLDMDGGYAGIP